MHGGKKLILNNNLFTRKKTNLKKFLKINFETQVGQEKSRSVEKTQDGLGGLVYGP